MLNCPQSYMNYLDNASVNVYIGVHGVDKARSGTISETMKLVALFRKYQECKRENATTLRRTRLQTWADLLLREIDAHGPVHRSRIGPMTKKMTTAIARKYVERIESLNGQIGDVHADVIAEVRSSGESSTPPT